MNWCRGKMHQLQVLLECPMLCLVTSEGYLIVKGLNKKTGGSGAMLCLLQNPVDT